MSQNLTQRFNGVVKAKLKQVSMGQTFGYDVSATIAPVVTDAGQITGFQHHWLVTVSTPNPVQGQVDIAMSLPIGGVVPPDFIFEKLVEQLWETCMQTREKVLNPPELADKPLKVDAPAVEPAAPRVKRERNTSFFPSKPGSELTAES